MKVTIDASCLVLNRYSGLSEVVHNLISNLPSISENNQITLFLNFFRKNGSWRNLYYPGTVQYRFRLPRRFVHWWWDRDYPVLDGYLKNIDVFHSLHINVPPTKKIKTILTVHDCRYLAYPDLYHAQEVAMYKHRMETSLKRVDGICAVSEFTRNELLKYFNISSKKLKVIHNGFAPLQNNNGINKREADHYIKKNNLPETYLFFIGTLDPRKNLNRLFEAIARCRINKKDFPDILLVGVDSKQWTESRYALNAKKIGLIDHIHPCGILCKELVAGLAQKACALCYPSLYEGFGFPPLEAMSLGVPVLAGRASSIPEVVGDSACLVDPESVNEIAAALNKIVYDSDYRKLLVEAGYRQISKFSWKKTAAHYLSFYKEIFNS